MLPVDIAGNQLGVWTLAAMMRATSRIGSNRLLAL
jgi:hypothetical protein